MIIVALLVTVEKAVMNIKVFCFYSSGKGFIFPGMTEMREREMNKGFGKSICHFLWFISHLFCVISHTGRVTCCSLILWVRGLAFV